MAQTTSDPTEPQTIQSTDLRVHAREILEQVKWHGAVYVVTTFGQPSAVIVPEEMFRKWNTVAHTLPATREPQ